MAAKAKKRVSRVVSMKSRNSGIPKVKFKNPEEGRLFKEIWNRKFAIE